MAELAIRGGTPVRTRPYPEWPQFDEEERKLLLEVLDSGRWWSTEGEKVAEFERIFGRLHGTGPAVAVTNGTLALEVVLPALGVGEGDEVIIPDYTFLATASAVLAVNAVPVMVDVEADSFCIDPEAVEAAVTPRTKAVVAVHLAGHPADLDRLTEFCRRHDLILIEDCAHAHGSSWRSTPVGSIGHAGTFSFQQSKLMTAGEGGAVISRDPDTAARVRSFADCGRRPGEWFYRHFVLGGNFRMTEWQAAVLLAQLGRFPEQTARRNENGSWLAAQLREIPGVIPQARDPRTSSQGYYVFIVRISPEEFGAEREAVRLALEAEGIPMTMSYPPIHRLDCFADPDGFVPRYRERGRLPQYGSMSFPQTERASARTLWFKHQCLLGSREDTAAIVEAMEKVHRHADELRDWGEEGSADPRSRSWSPCSSSSGGSA